MIKRNVIILSVVLTIELLASGCGSSVSSSIDDGKIVIGTNAEYEPFEYLDENGNMTGFDIDLMTAISKKIGCSIEWVDMPFDSLIGSMEAGDVEMIAAAIAPTDERKRSCDFSDVYYTGTQSIVTNKGTLYSTLQELNGKTVAVLQGSISDMIASGENTDYGVVSKCTVKRFQNATQAIQELENKAADAVLIDTIIAKKFVEDRQTLIETAIDGTGEDTVFAVRKGDSKLQDLLNKGLKEVKEDGTYDTLYDKYFAKIDK